MLQIRIVSIFVCVTFVAENLLSELLGERFSPNLLIILVVFFNFFRGIRYSLLTAFLAGLLKDSFSVSVFGVNIFSFIMCAYLSTFIKVHIYQVGSNASRLLIVFLVNLIFIGIQYVLHVMLTPPLSGMAGLSPIDFSEMFVYVLIPEILTTTIVTIYVFEKFKKCALKLFA